MSGTMDPIGGPVVTITLREIWEAVTRLTGRVDVLIEQHSALQRDQQEHERAAEQRHADHEHRIRELEARRVPMPVMPALAVLIALLSAAVAAIALLRG